MKPLSIARVVAGSLLFGLLGLVNVSEAVPLFSQCNSIPGNNSTGCNILITSTASGLTVQVDPTAAGFGGEDQFVAVVNNSTTTLLNIFLSAGTTPIFGFDGDGTYGTRAGCTVANGCDYAPQDGSVTFSGFNAALTSGFVNFTNGLAPGATALFELEETITASGGITVGPGPGTVPEPESLALLGLGLAGLWTARRKAVRK